MFSILIAILAVLVIGAFLLHKSFGEWDNVLVFIFGFITAIAGVILAIGYAIAGWSWFAAEHQARIINQEYGTKYTQEEIFWASDVVDEIRELQRQRIEVNGNIMGHGKDSGEEK